MNNTMNIEFISAGAGSGKTYKLTQTLAQALADGSARPHAVLATTFTVKAATELRERARAWLLEQGRVDLATAIGQARLGTVNSVCGQMLQRFCFELGLSPDQTVLGEGQAKRLLTATLGETLDAEGQQELLHLTHRLGIEQEDWANTLKAVVDAALANDITPAALRPMGLRNAELMLAHWPHPTAADTDPTATLTDALGDALQAVSKMVEAQKAAGAAVAQNLQNGLGDLQRLERAFREGHWSWPDWLAAAGLEAGAKAKHLLESVKEAAQAHDSHPQFHADVRQYLQRVFEIAAEGLGAYAEAKKALGAVDFSDQEVLLLRAIRHNASVREALESELDLVMVDEFQDTSPLQLALFIELARLAKRSIWVGDPKQAIYGFRGTDARLIAGVLQAIPAWGGTLGQALTQSRRSTPAQVGLSNAVFGQAFAPELSPEQVCLSATRQVQGLNGLAHRQGSVDTVGGGIKGEQNGGGSRHGRECSECAAFYDGGHAQSAIVLFFPLRFECVAQAGPFAEWPVAALERHGVGPRCALAAAPGTGAASARFTPRSRVPVGGARRGRPAAPAGPQRHGAPGRLGDEALHNRRGAAHPGARVDLADRGRLGSAAPARRHPAGPSLRPG